MATNVGGGGGWRNGNSWRLYVVMVALTVAIVRSTDYVYGATWYSTHGLSFAGLYGTPNVSDPTNGDVHSAWSESLALQVRMTAVLYATFAIAGIIGALVHIYLIPWMYARAKITATTAVAKKMMEEENRRRSVAADVSWERLTHYIVLLALTTSVARAIIHAVASSELMPNAAAMSGDVKTVYSDQLSEIKKGEGKEPPVVDYADFAGETRCNSVLESETDLCKSIFEKDTASGSASSGTTPSSSQPVCTSTPCPVGQVIDTDAIGGPLSAFGKVRPVPSFSTALPYADMWRDF